MPLFLHLPSSNLSLTLSLARIAHEPVRDSDAGRLAAHRFLSLTTWLVREIKMAMMLGGDKFSVEQI